MKRLASYLIFLLALGIFAAPFAEAGNLPPGGMSVVLRRLSKKLLFRFIPGVGAIMLVGDAIEAYEALADPEYREEIQKKLEFLLEDLKSKAQGEKIR